jgi:hypothetical protein
MRERVSLESAVKVDTDRSTVHIGGRCFPAALVICPPEDWHIERDEYDRSLGGGSHLTTEAIIPAENGVLFGVETMGADRPGLQLRLNAATCERVAQGQADEQEAPWIWIPHAVSVVDGDLVAGWHGIWQWSNADPEWVVETIDRLSRKPFERPDGPVARVVPLNYFERPRRAALGFPEHR